MSLLANSNAIETGGYQISRSVRLRSSANAYLNRTPASASNRRTWTWSAWAKRSNPSANGTLFAARTGSGATYFVVSFQSAGDFRIESNLETAYPLYKTNALFRDPSAWYHIVVALDMTQATSTNRLKVYVNNVLQTTASFNVPAQNTDLAVNSTETHLIGQQASASYNDGYMTEINFIDGQALDPSSFGQTDTITGSWVAKKYTGSYGTNGFFLTFADNSAATSTTIGKDYSGNGNNWTPNNISVTAGTTYDSMLDVPSGNGYADGGNGRGNYATLNSLNKNSVITTSNGNLAFTASNDRFVTSTIAVNSGKWYLEFSPTGGSTGTTGIGVIRASDNVFGTNTFGGSGTWAGVGYANNGQKSISGTLTSFGATYTTGSLIGVALDLDSGTQTITFYKNNVSQGTINLPISSETWVVATNYSEAGTHTINFGQRPFSYTPPTGFKALNTTNLSEPTIKKGSSYFNAALYTGNGNSSRSFTGFGFQPDFIWSKARSGGASDHALADVVRGVGGSKLLYTNLTSAEGTYPSFGAISSFDADGYSINSSGAFYNSNTVTYVDWFWKANGAGVSNTAGSITSTVSANTTSGFSIVTWTAQSSGTGTVGHGLGVAPSLIIVKSRTVSPSGWNVYHSALGATKVLYLNTTDAEATSSGNWNNTSPTSTVFTSGTGFASGGNMVSYCFAAVPGYSAFGSYTANASADGPFIYTGFRPRWIMLKRSSAAGAPWSMFDTSRNTYNSTNLELDANTSSSESTSGNGMDILSNGFKLRDSAYLNSSSGDTFIYAAFAENPMKFSNAR